MRDFSFTMDITKYMKIYEKVLDCLNTCKTLNNINYKIVGCGINNRGMVLNITADNTPTVYYMVILNKTINSTAKQREQFIKDEITKVVIELNKKPYPYEGI